MLGAFQTPYRCHRPTAIPSGPARLITMEFHAHEVEAIYASTNPSCDMLNLYDRSTFIARIHDQLWIAEVLGPQQGFASSRIIGRLLGQTAFLP